MLDFLNMWPSYVDLMFLRDVQFASPSGKVMRVGINPYSNRNNIKQRVRPISPLSDKRIITSALLGTWSTPDPDQIRIWSPRVNVPLVIKVTCIYMIVLYSKQKILELFMYSPLLNEYLPWFDKSFIETATLALVI